jgi:type II secretory pathway component PulF
VFLPDFVYIGPWIGPVVAGTLTVFLLVAVTTPLVRRALRWRVAAFREASLAQIASALALMLKSGVSLDNALALVVQMEQGTPAEKELIHWRQNLAAGQGKFSDLAAGGKVFPPQFVWTVGQSGEDLAAGFQNVSESCQANAAYRCDLLLYSALPCAVLGLGVLIIIQILPILMVLVRFMNALSGDGM